MSCVSMENNIPLHCWKVMNGRKCHFMYCNSQDIFAVIIEENLVNGNLYVGNVYCQRHYYFMRNIMQNLREKYYFQQKLLFHEKSNRIQSNAE